MTEDRRRRRGGMALGNRFGFSGGLAMPDGISAWILATNFWRDVGLWIDTEVWRD